MDGLCSDLSLWWSPSANSGVLCYSEVKKIRSMCCGYDDLRDFLLLVYWCIPLRSTIALCQPKGCYVLPLQHSRAKEWPGDYRRKWGNSGEGGITARGRCWEKACFHGFTIAVYIDIFKSHFTDIHFHHHHRRHHHRHHHHHQKHQGLDPLIRSVSRVTTARANASSVFQLFSFLVVCSGMISKGFGFVAFFASVEAISVCIHLSCLVCL